MENRKLIIPDQNVISKIYYIRGQKVMLDSKQAIQANIQVMRIFTKIRQMLADNTEIRLEVEKIKNKLESQDKNMEIVFKYLDELLEKSDKPIRRENGSGSNLMIYNSRLRIFI